MNPDYDKVIEFFNEHETAIYGFGPTDDGAEECSLLWCIKELDDIYNRSKGIVLADRGTMLKNQILNVLCTLIDVYEKEDAEERELNSEITTLMNDLAAKESEVEYLKSELIKEKEESSTRCETCKNYESSSDITGWCSACPGTVIKDMNINNVCAAYEKRRANHGN